MKKIGIFLAVVFTLSACSKLNKENYEQLKMGMSQEEIQGVIGKPDNCSETMGTKSCIWGNEDATHIKVTFVADNAATFSNNGLK